MPTKEQIVKGVYDHFGFERSPKGLYNLSVVLNHAQKFFMNRVEGLENLEALVQNEGRPAIFIANHVMMMDPHYLGLQVYNFLLDRFEGDIDRVYKNYPWFVARRDLMNRDLIISELIARSPALMMEEDIKNNPQRVIKDFETIKTHLDAGNNLFVFPQGRRYDPTNPPRNKRGEIDPKSWDNCLDIAAWIAYNVDPKNPPVIFPVYVDGMEGLGWRDFIAPKSRRIVTTFGKPFELDPTFNPEVKGFEYISEDWMCRLRNRGPYEKKSGELFQRPVDLKPW